nr:hypothetical protein GCM10020092_006660 [Actinoplanes digitatis]
MGVNATNSNGTILIRNLAVQYPGTTGYAAERERAAGAGPLQPDQADDHGAGEQPPGALRRRRDRGKRRDRLRALRRPDRRTRRFGEALA